MKKISLFTLLICFFSVTHAQNIGIGVTSPKEKLDINGAIKIAGTNSATPAAGTIRWNTDKNDFEGYNGKAWVSLTGGKSQWGDPNAWSYETGMTDDLIQGKEMATSLACYGDWLVTGIGKDNAAGVGNSGSFKMYKRETGIWKIKEAVHEMPGAVHNAFAGNVAMTANFVVASAAGADVNGNDNQGAVLVYTYDDHDAYYSTTLTASDGYIGDYLGYSLAMHDNLIIAGAPYNNILFAEKQGSAYIFQYNGSTWQQVANLYQPGNHTYDQLGQSVAIYGNYAAVGSKSAKVNDQVGQGKVCIFQNNGGTWSYLTTITSPVNAQYQYYGCSMSMVGDTLVVGSSDNVSDSHANGKVFVYIRSGNTWNLQATLTDPDGHENDGFGTSVHMNKGLLIVGSPQAWVNGTRQGKSFIYKSTPQGWALQAVLAASNGKVYDEFGNVVLINEHTAFCSAPLADIKTYEDNGRVYFFKRSN